MSEKVYIVDGSGYIFRAYYAIQKLTTRAGFPTNALYGFVRMITKLLSQADSEHVVMVFDTGAKTFRHEMYAEYKANRKECPDDLVPQMPLFREISKAFGLVVLEQPGFEADDVIATLVERLKHSNTETVVISGDKDLTQLVGGPVKIWDAMKDVWLDENGVKEKMGVFPEKVVDLLALIGDASDNVPGVEGIGPKTALQLLEGFGGVDEILKAPEAIRAAKNIRNRDKIAAQIESSPDMLRLSKKLVTVDRHSPVELEFNGSKVLVEKLSDEDLIKALLRVPPDPSRFAELIERLEFTSLVKNLKLDVAARQESSTAFNYITVYRSEFEGFVAELVKQKEFAFDVETTDLDTLAAKLVGVSFCWADDKAYYIPLRHAGDPRSSDQIDPEQALLRLKPILENPSIGKVGQNLKYDIKVMAQQGIAVAGITFDTLLASYLLAPDRRSHNLGSLAQDYLGHTVSEYEDVVGDLPDFSHVPIESATQYSAEDAHISWLLRNKLAAALDQNELRKVFGEIEVPLVPVLAEMERNGVKLDIPLLSELSDEFAGRLGELEQQIYSLAGTEFNINSPKQLAVILFERLAIPTKGLKKTKTGISTDSSVLEHIQDLHPVPRLLLEYRQLHKLKSTYVDTLPVQVSAITGRLHSTFNQTITATGRLSSSDPNLQNIPIRTFEGRRIRTAFIAEPGKKLISADYSQVELRLLAHITEEPALVQAFNSGLDIHEQTARELFKVPGLLPVDAEQRRAGKTINFGVLYGMGAFRLARHLGIPFKTAKEYIENYFGHYPKVRAYFDQLVEQSRTQGFVTTIFGRKRNISDIDLSGRDRDFASRAAMNAPIQGSAADLIKLAMIKIEAQRRKHEWPLLMILQVHDELLFECPAEHVEEMVAHVRTEMESVVQLKVPLQVDVGQGMNWQECHQ